MLVHVAAVVGVGVVGVGVGAVVVAAVVAPLPWCSLRRERLAN